MSQKFFVDQFSENKLWHIILGPTAENLTIEKLYLLHQMEHWEHIALLTGMSIQQAQQVLAVLEIGRRLFQRSTLTTPILNSPQTAYRHLKDMAAWDQEMIRALYLDSKLQLIRDQVIAIGTLNTAHTQIREIIRPAFVVNAHTFILAHNHPSGDKNPSQEDIHFTKQIMELSTILGIPMQDHLVIAATGFTSLCQQFPDLFNTSPKLTKSRDISE